MTSKYRASAHYTAKKALRKLQYRISIIRQLNPSNPDYRTMINELDRDATRKLATLDTQTPGVALAWRNAAFRECDALDTDYPHLFDTTQPPHKKPTQTTQRKNKPTHTTQKSSGQATNKDNRDRLATALDTAFTAATTQKNNAQGTPQQRPTFVEWNRLNNWRKQLPHMSDTKINKLLHQLDNQKENDP